MAGSRRGCAAPSAVMDPHAAAGRRPRCLMRKLPGGRSQRLGPARRSRARASQSPRAAADSRRGAGFADTGVARDARAGPCSRLTAGGRVSRSRTTATIVTSALDVMWGTGRRAGVDRRRRWVWTFAAVDHWNAECVGWHVCKVGSRFAALEPVAQGAPAMLRLGRGRRGPRAGAPDGSPRPVSVGPHPQPGPLLGASAPASACSKIRRPTASSNAGIALSRSRSSTAGSFEPRRRARRRRRVRRLEKLAHRTPLEAREEYELRQAA